MTNRSNKKIFGVGLNDLDKKVLSDEGKISKVHQVWYNMLSRCYNRDRENISTYNNCFVCDDWLRLSNFASWFYEHYIDGWALDKDILIKGNKIYSPETCCFVPQEINSIITKHDKKRGDYPIGVYYKNNGWQKKYVAALRINGKRRAIGSFLTAEEAFRAYKEKKEEWIKEVANKWKDKIEYRVYEAMCNYKVEITD